MEEAPKPVHTLVLDTGAIIKNEPTVSTLISKAEKLVTVPAIISEIKDETTRSRVETLLMPFLTVRQPSPASMKFVTDFARRTGDLPVLSKPDLQIIALTYELELERNGGDWRLRKMPGQKGLNGPFPAKETKEEGAEGQAQEAPASTVTEAPVQSAEPAAEVSPPVHDATTEASSDAQIAEQPKESAEIATESAPEPAEQTQDSTKDVTETLAETSLNDEAPAQPQTDSTAKVDSAQTPAPNQEDSDSDSEGWITPSNLKQKQAEHAKSDVADAYPQKTMEVAVLTTDYAMQNTILQINLNLLSSSMMRIRHVRSMVLRCQACFLVTKEMNKQFCPRCGKPTLTRVSCSTATNGEFKIHLKKNFQYNSRGDRYSIPKAVAGASNGKVKGGGKGGWGNGLILAEDQKEYERALTSEKRHKERNLMDEDYLPGILTGDRNKSGSRIKVGAGRNVNSKKRH
ncbi:hypothetical protein Q7P37_000862 [Cladosporium fusiforme]